jgi:hypothetical protein
MANNYMNQQLRQDGFKTDFVGDIPPGTPDAEADHAMMTLLQSADIGFLQDVSLDNNRFYRFLRRSRTPPIPLVVIEVNDDEIEPGQPFDLIYQGTSDNYHYMKMEDNPDPDPVAGDVRMNFPVIQYRAVPVSS